MNAICENWIEETRIELDRILARIELLKKKRRDLGKQKDAKAFNNYSVIMSYGCIERVLRYMLADYCGGDLADDLVDNSKIAINFGRGFYKFLERHDLNGLLRKMKTEKGGNPGMYMLDKSSTMEELVLSNTLFSTARHSIAHGTVHYTDHTSEIRSYFLKAVKWLYEVDHAINELKNSTSP